MSQPLKKVTQTTTPSKTPPLAGSTADSPDKETMKLLDKLDIKTKAVNANNIARVANSHLTSAEEKLQPLLSLKTNRPIERFPETSKGLGRLSVTLVDSILLALEADRSGNEEVKRERLRVQIGLKPNPA
ncbi:hypothetical protein BDV97DRAFT_401629 [Delphinella strobiligena]|nr:hypothetical protein BDV97DRAFT_401629 [Delphinella strobiligena]